MKSLIYPVLLAALVAGCAETPSKEAEIQEIGGKPVKSAQAGKSGEAVGKSTEAAGKGGPAIVEAQPAAAQAEADKVSTRPVAAGAAISEKAGKPAEAVTTSGAGIPSVSAQPAAAAKPVPAPVAKPAVEVRTQGVATPSSEAKPLEKDAAKPTDSAAATPPGAGDGAVPPAPDAVPPSWADLKNPDHLLGKRVLLFEYDSAAIREDYHALLDAHVAFIKANKEARVILQGHADERGSREYNLALGQRRAESVFKAMTLLGAPEDRLEAVSLGEEKPLDEGHDEAAWQRNRRAEIVYQGE